MASGTRKTSSPRAKTPGPSSTSGARQAERPRNRRGPIMAGTVVGLLLLAGNPRALAPLLPIVIIAVPLAVLGWWHLADPTRERAARLYTAVAGQLKLTGGARKHVKVTWHRRLTWRPLSKSAWMVAAERVRWLRWTSWAHRQRWARLPRITVHIISVRISGIPDAVPMHSDRLRADVAAMLQRRFPGAWTAEWDDPNDRVTYTRQQRPDVALTGDGDSSGGQDSDLTAVTPAPAVASDPAADTADLTAATAAAPAAEGTAAEETSQVGGNMQQDVPERPDGDTVELPAVNDPAPKPAPVPVKKTSGAHRVPAPLPGAGQFPEPTGRVLLGVICGPDGQPVTDPPNIVHLHQDDSRWWLAIDLDKDNPHWRFHGATGGGKSSTLRRFILEFVRNGWKVVAVDAKFAGEFLCVRRYNGVHVPLELDEMVAAIFDVLDTMRRRYQAFTEAKDRVARQDAAGLPPEDWDPLPRFTPMLLVVDEYMELLRAVDDETRRKLLSGFSTMGQQGRKARVHFVLGAQNANVADEGGASLPTSIRNQMTGVVSCGPTSNGSQSRVVFDDSDFGVSIPSKPKGYAGIGVSGHLFLTRLIYVPDPLDEARYEDVPDDALVADTPRPRRPRPASSSRQRQTGPVDDSGDWLAGYGPGGAQ